MCSLCSLAEDTVNECLLAMTTLQTFDAESITSAIEEQLMCHGIDELKCVSQSSNGAAVMNAAVQTRFKTSIQKPFICNAQHISSA